MQHSIYILGDQLLKVNFLKSSFFFFFSWTWCQPFLLTKSKTWYKEEILGVTAVIIGMSTNLSWKHFLAYTKPIYTMQREFIMMKKQKSSGTRFICPLRLSRTVLVNPWWYHLITRLCFGEAERQGTRLFCFSVGRYLKTRSQAFV